MARPRVKPCGTDAGYQYHRRHGEHIDDACRAAHADRNRPESTIKLRAMAQLAREQPGRFLEICQALRVIDATRRREVTR